MKNRIAIYGSSSQADYLSVLPRLFNFLYTNGFLVFIYDKFAAYLQENMVDTGDAIPSSSIPSDVSMVISLGGDGTFLRAARWIGHREIPILGVNTGHLGYLASCSLPETEEMIEKVCAGEISIERRMMLELVSDHFPADKWRYALNEITMMRHGSSMLYVNASVNENYLAEYRGDGLIVSTPTGSTAYSLSAGGPIIAPTVDCICLCPVAPHTLTLRPLVADSQSFILLKPQSRASKFVLTLDDSSYVLPASGEFIIRKAPFSTLVIRKKNEGFPSILRQKLLWSATP